MPRKTLAAHRLGRVPYGEAHELQKALVLARQRGEIGDTLLLLEHAPVITLGRAAKEANVLLGREGLAELGFELHEVGRGGDVTYHGPGQLVGYPIVDLSPDRRDVRKYVWSLEETMIRVAGAYGVTAGRVAGLNGAWVDAERKIGAVGVRISRWVTMHGFALNATTDLRHFQLIVPCGITDKAVTSLERELGRPVPMREVEDHAARIFAELFDADVTFHEGPPAMRVAENLAE
jgi:lipoyl(octanoyl) transferase